MIRAVVLFGVLDDFHPTGAVQETSQKLSKPLIRAGSIIRSYPDGTR